MSEQEALAVELSERPITFETCRRWRTPHSVDIWAYVLGTYAKRQIAYVVDRRGVSIADEVEVTV